MAVSPRLELRQTQSLVMTPQLQQAIKLLQLSNLELHDYVDRELEQNPLLERASPESLRETERYDGAAATKPRDSADGVRAESMPSEDSAPLDADYGNVYDPDSSGVGPGGPSLAEWNGRGGSFEDEDGPSVERTLSTEVSFREHVLEQLAEEIVDPRERLIGQALVDGLDESGYFTGDIEAIAELLACDVSAVETMLEKLQKFDPPGIFARNLKECLAIQLRELDRYDPAMAALLDNLELLAARELPALRRVCGVDAEDLADMIAEIKALNPKPASIFDSHVAQTVIPDVFVRRATDGGWIVELNNDTLPRVLVDMRYHSRVSHTAKSKEEKVYLAERLQSANWLVKSLDQRATTILKVATELVQQQEAFLERGIEYLRPLTLRDIAEAIGMHESTVSRVTNNKYIATPRGVHEMKYFFTSAIAHASGGAAHSAESVRYRIKALIDQEPADAVLSDDRIVEILNGSGIDIARRTVAKYREALRIPSSVQRRRLKMAHA
ncbi:MAG: RNA polymerase sigma-54 factor [Rhodospirillaceae bacterium]|nr:RNA polymerase sigma-54 factor [Rhodospirillaceae bacterium]